MIYGISYKTLIGSKPLQIRFDEIDGIIRIYSTLAIVTLLDFFAQSNCYIFLETLEYLETFQICLQFFFYFCTIYRPEQNEVIKPFFLDLYSSGQDTMLKFCTLTNTLKGYRSKKNFKMAAIMCILQTKTRFYVSGL